MTFALCFDAQHGCRDAMRKRLLSESCHFIEGGGVARPYKLITAQRRRAALLLVFQRLNPVELCGLARVCREWRAMTEHPALWKNVTLEEIPLNNMVSMFHS